MHNIKTTFQRAVQAHRQGNFEEALQYYTEVIASQNDYIDAHINLGLLFLKKGDNVAAIQQFTKVVELNPRSLVGHSYLGNIYLSQDRLEAAEKSYEAVLKINPNDCEVLNNQGVIALKRNNTQQAIDYFHAALKAEPKHKESRSNLAAVLLQQDNWKEAIWHYQLYLQLMPEDPEAHYNLGVAYMNSGNLLEAITEFEFVLDLIPQQVNALCNVGAVYLKLDQKIKSIEYYQKALEFEPENEMVCYLLDALLGKKNHSAPPINYIQNLFDNYASTFEQHVTKTLNYEMPDLMRKIMDRYEDKKQYKTLDLGCGTGLSGIAFRSMASELIGVDISLRMLKKADDKNIYDQLVEMEVVTFLEQVKEKVELIIAADTVVYFGDLERLFFQCYRVLSNDGYWIFSTEMAGEKDYQLQTSGRYAHHRDYIRKLADKNGFKWITCENVTGRYQQGKPVSSEIFILRK